jgi:hypothetical protein
MRRGPGLAGTVARTAVSAGTAAAVSKGVSGAMDAQAQAEQEVQAADEAAYQTQADVERPQRIATGDPGARDATTFRLTPRQRPPSHGGWSGEPLRRRQRRPGGAGLNQRPGENHMLYAANHVDFIRASV